MEKARAVNRCGSGVAYRSAPRADVGRCFRSHVLFHMTLFGWLVLGKDVAGEIASAKSTKPSPIKIKPDIGCPAQELLRSRAGQKPPALSLSWDLMAAQRGCLYTVGQSGCSDNAGDLW
jgi:hypothetical protein